MNDLTRRGDFEAEFPIPDDVYYNAKLDSYCWISYPNTPQPEYDAMWAAWQAGFSAGVRSSTVRQRHCRRPSLPFRLGEQLGGVFSTGTSEGDCHENHQADRS